MLEQHFQDFNKDSERDQHNDQRVQSLSKLVEGMVNVKLESIVKNQMNETMLPALERGQASYLQNATNLVEQVSYIFGIFCIFGKSNALPKRFCLMSLLMKTSCYGLQKFLRSRRIHTPHIK